MITINVFKKPRMVAFALGFVLAARLNAADPAPQAPAKDSPKPAPAKRLSPQERRELLHHSSRRLPADPEKLRRLTNGAPRQVEGRVDRTAERVNAALNASKQSAPAP